MSLNSTYYWKEDEFVTGDNLETLADYIFDIGNYLTGDHGRSKTSKTEQTLIDESIEEINKQKPSVLYCYGHDTHRLLNNLDKIDCKFKLMTHNSDNGIMPEYEKFVDNDKIIKWFGQNNFLNNKKVVSLPIGIARKKYPHGNTELLSRYSQNIVKTSLCYKNFTVGTNYDERSAIDYITNKNGIPMSNKCEHEEYIDNISRSMFVISPPGNGIDCHRIWECLYLRTIPVVKFHPVLSQFKEFPILFVDDWNEVTIDFLKSKLSIQTKFDTKLDKLSFNFWKNLITQ